MVSEEYNIRKIQLELVTFQFYENFSSRLVHNRWLIIVIIALSIILCPIKYSNIDFSYANMQ